MRVLFRSHILTPILFTTSALTLVLSSRSALVASFLNRNVSSLVRGFFGAISSVFPFSLFEFFLASFPLLLISSLIYIFYATETREIRRRFTRLMLAIVGAFALFTLTLGVAYNSEPISESVVKLTAYDQDSIISTAETLCREVNALCDRGEPQGYSKIRKALKKSYTELLQSTDIRVAFLPTPKRLLMSSLFERMGVLAFYSFASGEININSNIPEHSVPFTLAHEYAHFLGASGEEDANFMAFAACTSSDNDGVRYSGYISALEYFLSQIKRNDREMYTKLYNSLEDKAKNDMLAYSRFASDNSSPIFIAADTLNSAHLEIWDKDGKSGYSLFVGRIVSYISSISKEVHST